MNFFAQVSHVDDAHDQIMLGVLAIVGSLIATFAYVVRNGSYAKTAAQESRAANHAVNNIGPEKDHTLYKLVEKISGKQEEFDRTWGNLPEDIDDAVSLSSTLFEIHRSISAIEIQLAELKEKS